MGRLFDQIRQLVAEERYVVGLHASDRLEERRIMEWQAVAGLLEGGQLLAERPDGVCLTFESRFPTVLSSTACGRSCANPTWLNL